MPRGKNQEIYALGEFPLCKMDKRVSMPSRLDERSQRARGSHQMGKKCGGRGRRSRSKTRVWMQRKMDAPVVGTGPAHTLGPPGKNRHRGWQQEPTFQHSAKTGSVGAHSSEEIWNFAP